MIKKSTGTPKQTKRAAPKSAWRKGQSGNPKGRVRDGQSFAAVLRDFLAMDGKQIAEACTLYAKEFRQLPTGVNLRSVIALKWITSVINDPTPGLLQQLVDRVDGPVPTKVEGSLNTTRYVIDIGKDESTGTDNQPETRRDAGTAGVLE